MLVACSNDLAFDVPQEAFNATTPASIDVRKIIRELPLDSVRAMALWQEQTGEFGAEYVTDILRIGEPSDPRCMSELKRFIAHPDVAPIELAIDSTSGDSEVMNSHEKTLTEAFQRFHYFFPADQLPALAWMNSGFNYAVYPTEGTLGIGLDWFLGPEHPIVGTLAPHIFPQYMRNRMQPDLIPAAALRGWLLVHFSNPWYRSERCVDELLYWGKILFILEQCLPDTPQHSLLDWSASGLGLGRSTRARCVVRTAATRCLVCIRSARVWPVVFRRTVHQIWCHPAGKSRSFGSLHGLENGVRVHGRPPRDNASAADDLDRLHTRRESVSSEVNSPPLPLKE